MGQKHHKAACRMWTPGQAKERSLESSGWKAGWHGAYALASPPALAVPRFSMRFLLPASPQPLLVLRLSAKASSWRQHKV